ncbi:MAG TPA: dephospho-CoA kinase [Anaerolineae bacterium]|nr:dephospho-CoA kinase [Anaerolineae bacterium]MCB0180387.1 dephospho-CoA kinase [Anaerolineae bacterium]MCB0222321.1 dephospho-CoA kinase [Anaerolineae bacterium]HRV94694.1 dephospho-CoA kinase [Anaerolineae bacterium]
MADKIVIGLTGNIATGKSIVMRMLQELGATPIDADKLVHQLMQKGGPVYQAIVEEFGKYVLDEKGQISRPRLGKIVFSQPNALARLEALTHPSVIKEVKRLVAEVKSPVVVIEAIKLFESGLADECQSVWVVTAPPEMQLRRLVERRRMAPDQAKQRIRAQGSQREKAIKADIIIDNSGALVKTWQIVKKHYTDLVEANRPVQVAPEPEPVEAAPTPAPENSASLVIRRAKRDDLGGMSKLISTATGGTIDPDISDMMESLFSRAYLVALSGGQIVGMVGWQTENLVAGLQDFYMIKESLWSTVAEKMLSKVEEEVDSLSCEVALVFVLNQAGQKPIEFLESQSYERAESSTLIPDWREAAVEWQPESSILLYKKLREQRIMVPM